MGRQQLPGDRVPISDAGERCASARSKWPTDSLFSKTQSPGTEGISLSSLHPFEQLQCPKTALWIFTRSVDTNKCSIQNVTQNPQKGSPDGCLSQWCPATGTDKIHGVIAEGCHGDGWGGVLRLKVAGFKSQPSHDLDG